MISQYLDLQDNPWHCDCHNQWIISYLIPAINATSPELLAGETPLIKCQGLINFGEISTAVDLLDL